MKKKYLTALLLGLAIILSASTYGYSAIAEPPSSNEYSTDLNGDGKAETISAEFSEMECVLHIGGETVKVQGCNFLPKLFITDIDKKDKKREVY